jgi:non-ribosomal peptide synthetase component F
VLRFYQPPIALQLTLLGETQAPATRMVTCEIGAWTLRFDLRVVCKKLRAPALPQLYLAWGYSHITVVNMQQLTYASFDHWLAHIQYTSISQLS